MIIPLSGQVEMLIICLPSHKRILVGGFKPWNFIFRNIWDIILPIDFHIFQDGYRTTNQFFFDEQRPAFVDHFLEMHRISIAMSLTGG